MFRGPSLGFTFDFFFVVLGIELNTFELCHQHFLLLVYFSHRVLSFLPACGDLGQLSTYLCLLYNCYYRHYAKLVFEIQSCYHFCLGWPPATVLPSLYPK
jgi:hypothetical protein